MTDFLSVIVLDKKKNYFLTKKMHANSKFFLNFAVD